MTLIVDKHENQNVDFTIFYLTREIVTFCLSKVLGFSEEAILGIPIAQIFPFPPYDSTLTT